MSCLTPSALQLESGEAFIVQIVRTTLTTMDLALKSPRPAEPFPIKAEPPYDTTLDHAPFETLKEYYPCPAAGVSRTLMTQDIEGAQSFAGIKDPLDPMVLFFLWFFSI